VFLREARGARERRRRQEDRRERERSSRSGVAEWRDESRERAQV